MDVTGVVWIDLTHEQYATVCTALKQEAARMDLDHADDPSRWETDGSELRAILVRMGAARPVELGPADSRR